MIDAALLNAFDSRVSLRPSLPVRRASTCANGECSIVTLLSLLRSLFLFRIYATRGARWSRNIQSVRVPIRHSRRSHGSTRFPFLAAQPARWSHWAGLEEGDPPVWPREQQRIHLVFRGGTPG